jgi:iron uptake system component EfeO
MMKPKLQSVILAIAGFILVSAIGLTQVQATQVKQSFPSTPKPTQVADARLNTRVEQGLEYFRDLAAQQLSLTEELLVTLKSGDLEAARDAYVEARPPYEEIEVLAASFEQEDSDIDARPYAFAEGEASSEFKGFHRVERFLFRDNDIEAAIPYTEELLVSIRSLINKLDDPSNFNPSLNFEGIIALATEVPAKKISSEEETWSGQTLLIFKHNWRGIYSQYEPFADLLDSRITEQVDTAYEACMDSIAPFFTEGKTAAVPYTNLSAGERREIVQASYEFRNALIQARNALGIS